MRADRLLSLMLILQARGRCSARELAAELEVSERTIYRDMTALSSAGVPVYAETGRNGGFMLVDRFRTDLTGLTEQEIQALTIALLAHRIPQPLSELGVAGHLEGALLKLSAALPDRFRREEQWVRQRFVMDLASWGPGPKTPNLLAVQEAVWEDRKLLIRYNTISGGSSEQVVHAYGLAVKAGIWYLVYARQGNFQARQVANLISAQALEETFLRAVDFDLQEFWQGWVADHQEQPLQYEVTVRLRANLLPQVAIYLYGQTLQELMEAQPGEEQGYITGKLRFERFETARSQLLSLGGAVEVLDPQELRVVIKDYAKQVLAIYASR